MHPHPLLDPARLGPRVTRLVGAGATPAQRELAARALVPLPGAESWLALYQLWAEDRPPHAAIAGRTAGELPSAAILAALADPLLPAPALDFMARRRFAHEAELVVLVRHPQLGADAACLLARCGPARVCEAICAAQQRFLAAPAILSALARNPSCPPASLHAALELGARERAPGLAGLRAALLSGHVLVDSPPDQAAWLARARGSRPGEALEPAPPLPPDPAALAPLAPAGPPAARPRVEARPYAARVDQILDPSTPLPLAMSLLRGLRPGDLRRVAAARRLPQPLVAAARRRLGGA